MTSLRAKWSRFIDQQHREPAGMIGRIIGERMLRQHKPETDWSIGLLQLAPTDRLLELGFGAGRALALASRLIDQGQIVGLDRSATMVRAAQLRNQNALAVRRLALLRGNLSELPFAGQSFDKIVSIHTFYFWPDAATMCRRRVDALRPGGRLVSTLATGQLRPSGEWVFWPLQQQVEALIQRLQAEHGMPARLMRGPDSRRYNNVALVIDRC